MGTTSKSSDPTHVGIEGDLVTWWLTKKEGLSRGGRAREPRLARGDITVATREYGRDMWCDFIGLGLERES